MRILPALFLSTAATLALAQQKPSPEEQAAKDQQARLRVEGAVSGLGEITPQEKAGAAVGAGPHLQATPGPAHRVPLEASPSAAAGGTAGGDRAGEQVESRDARQPAQRP